MQREKRAEKKKHKQLVPVITRLSQIRSWARLGLALGYRATPVVVKTCTFRPEPRLAQVERNNFKYPTQLVFPEVLRPPEEEKNAQSGYWMLWEIVWLY